MKYEVIKTFRDKDTKKVHKVGTSYYCSEERYTEIQGKGSYLARTDKKPYKVEK